MASGATVRDRKKESSWRRHLKAQRQGGLSVAAYCRRHGVREYGFYWWRRELARRDAAVPAAFVPVHVTVERPSAEQERGGIEIVLPGDQRVRVTGPAVDRRMLRDVLWALEEGRLGREEAGRC
jgi:transposase-like protein